MKYSSRYLLTSLILSLSLLLFACGSDDDETIDNHIVVEGKKYAINDFLLYNYGAQDLLYRDSDPSKTHYGFGVQFSDGVVIDGPAANSATYLIVMSFHFPIANNNGDAIPTGEWHSLSPVDFFGGKIPVNERFFTTYLIRIDQNGNSLFGSSEGDKFLDASEGTINVTHDGDKYTFEFKNSVTDPDPNTPVTGYFSGTVRYHD